MSLVVAQMTETTGLSCDQSNIVYSMSVSPPASFSLTFDAATRTLTWSTSNINDAGTYTITITGKITRISDSKSATSVFNINVATCATSTESTLAVLTGTAIPAQTFDIGSAATPTEVTFDSMTVTGSNYCKALDIVYTLEVDTDSQAGSTSLFPWNSAVSFFTFDSTTRVLSWSNANANNVGTWTLRMTGSINRNNYSS
jgi:hypothetical protein